MAESEKLTDLVKELANEDQICRRLMTIPGVGPISALIFVASVDDPMRFENSRDVAAYFGLTPRVYQSGTTTRSGRISHRGDTDVRKTLFMASRVLLTSSRSLCSLRQWGLALAKRKGSKVAIVAVARKLAVLMHHLWMTGEEFDRGR